MHTKGFKRKKLLDRLKQFEIARFNLNGKTQLVTPKGKKHTAAQWARELTVSYTPSIVFFDGTSGEEIFRLEAYVRPFHLSSSFEYVGSGAYKTQPEFQRFLHEKTTAMRERKQKVDLWK